MKGELLLLFCEHCLKDFDTTGSYTVTVSRVPEWGKKNLYAREKKKPTINKNRNKTDERKKVK